MSVVTHPDADCKNPAELSGNTPSTEIDEAGSKSIQQAMKGRIAPAIFTADEGRSVAEKALRDIRAALSRMIGIFELVLEDCWDDHDLATFRGDAIVVTKKLCAIEDVTSRSARPTEVTSREAGPATERAA